MVNNRKLSMRNVLKAVSKFLQVLKNGKPIQFDAPEEARCTNSLRRKFIRSGESAFSKLAVGDGNLNEPENLFVHTAVFFHDTSTSNLDQGDVFDLVEAVLNRK